jgi:hypothetical protein
MVSQLDISHAPHGTEADLPTSGRVKCSMPIIQSFPRFCDNNIVASIPFLQMYFEWRKREVPSDNSDCQVQGAVTSQPADYSSFLRSLVAPNLSSRIESLTRGRQK